MPDSAIDSASSSRLRRAPLTLAGLPTSALGSSQTSWVVTASCGETVRDETVDDMGKLLALRQALRLAAQGTRPSTPARRRSGCARPDKDSGAAGLVWQGRRRQAGA